MLINHKKKKKKKEGESYALVKRGDSLTFQDGTSVVIYCTQKEITSQTD